MDNPDFRALAQCRRLSELKADFEKKLRDPLTTTGATQYLRGILDGMERVLNLPASEIKQQQRIAQEEAKQKYAESAAGVWPTRALRSRLPRLRAGGNSKEA